jgi:uncharacterized protein (DUF1501 family)
MGLGATPLVACGAAVPAFLARSAAAVAAGPADAGKGRVLVVVQLDGGNDGLNTVAPYADDEYHKRRPKLRLDKGSVLKVDDRVGLHPSLRSFAKMLEERRLAVVQSVGYPNPNRSHFDSMAIWHTARPKPTADTPGWLARGLDARAAAAGGDAPAVHVGEELLPQALAGGQQHVPSFLSLEQFRRRLGVPAGPDADAQRAALDRIAGAGRGGRDSLLEFVERNNVLTYASSAKLEGLLHRSGGGGDYPEFFGLARRLRLVSQLIKAGLKTSIYYTQLGGFDTHANQAGTHAGLLQELDVSLKAFLDDLKKSGEDRPVVVLVFSEFGRRLGENASGGTDHGTAAPVFLLGPSVKAGLHGPYPNLHDLQDGDPKHALDFRRVYAALLDRWLGCPPAPVLGAGYEPLPVL